MIFRGMENMVFVCDHCHFEMEAVAKPCQCPDCGNVWRDVAPVLAG